ncbi:MAG: hypothetical protein M1820_001826 [Bogoriella megaspora]|nr:MAG: hypothetical protein M1820_001826 [Bogoriella megaspora]
MPSIPQSTSSSYTTVRVLLLQWEEDDLGVGKEVEKLAAVFSSTKPDGYNFSTERWYIPTSSDKGDEPEILLIKRILEFRKGAKQNDLLILYYGGHGGGSPQQLYWAANRKENSPSLIWHNVQGTLLGCPADVLLILDSCYASLAVSNHGTANNWMLGATTKEDAATGVARNSFTSTLTRELKRCAFKYWKEGERLSVQSLHSYFLRWERDLDFTPVLVRLTDFDCPPTDLTPLLNSVPRPGLSKVSTEPTNMPSAKSPNATSTVAPKLPETPPTSPEKMIYSIPLHTASPLSSAIDSPAPSKERTFRGLTCIHETNSGSNDGNAVDIVLVHGFGGHATQSFAYHNNAKMETKPWPCDVLAPLLARSSISSRVFTYSWNPSDSLYKARQISDIHLDLEQAVQRVRAGCSTRPLVFVGDGFGGMLIKQLVTDSINRGIMSDQDFDSPIQACFFLGLAQRGMDHGPDDGAYLASVKAVTPAISLPGDLLDSQASSISDTLMQFDMISKQWEIQCASFGNSKGLAFNLHYSHSIEGDNKNISQLKSDGNLQLVTATIHDTLASSMSARPSRLEDRPQDSERVFAKLKAYDTRFLVDDSDSMAGRKWARTKKVMAKIASIAVKYDTNGVDVSFFNNPVEDKKRTNLKSIDDVMNLFRDLYPEGETPTADKLDEELNEFCYEYKQDRKIKGLNLIILTDGAPSEGQDVEEVLVRYAKNLKDLHAPALKVGVQFVQIGVDEGAAKFLQKLDNDIREIYKLDRDMVDTVPWVEGDQEHLSEKILLGGILKRYDGE